MPNAPTLPGRSALPVVLVLLWLTAGWAGTPLPATGAAGDEATCGFCRPCAPYLDLHRVPEIPGRAGGFSRRPTTRSAASAAGGITWRRRPNPSLLDGRRAACPRSPCGQGGPPGLNRRPPMNRRRFSCRPCCRWRLRCSPLPAARVDFEESLDRANQEYGRVHRRQPRPGPDRRTARSHGENSHDPARSPLSQQDAVHLALVNSPAIQAMLARNWAEASPRGANPAASPTPGFVFARTTLADEVEFERAITSACSTCSPCRCATRRPWPAWSGWRGCAWPWKRWTRSPPSARPGCGRWPPRESLVYAQQVYEVGEISAELAAACSRWATSADCSTPASRPSTPMRPPAWPRPGRPRPPPGRSWSNARPLGYPGATAAAADACPTCRPARGTRPRSARRPARPGSTCSWPGPPTRLRPGNRG